MACLRVFLGADFQEPYAVVVLLEKDLVVIDLAQNGWVWLYLTTLHHLDFFCFLNVA